MQVEVLFNEVEYTVTVDISTAGEDDDMHELMTVEVERMSDGECKQSVLVPVVYPGIHIVSDVTSAIFSINMCSMEAGIHLIVGRGHLPQVWLIQDVRSFPEDAPFGPPRRISVRRVALHLASIRQAAPLAPL